MTDKKYELAKDHVITINGNTLYRIRALRSFADVKVGDLGGYVEHERNLSHAGYCWVRDNAMAYDLTRVTGNAQLCDSVKAFENSRIGGNAVMQGKSIVKGHATIKGVVIIKDKSIIDGCADLYGNVVIRRNSVVCGDTRLRGDCIIDNGYIPNGDAVVWFSNVGSERGTLTVYCGKTELLATRGCFVGTLDEFCTENATRPFSMNSKRFTREYELLVEMARLRLSKSQEDILRSAEK